MLKDGQKIWLFGKDVGEADAIVEATVAEGGTKALGRKEYSLKHGRRIMEPCIFTAKEDAEIALLDEAAFPAKADAPIVDAYMREHEPAADGLCFADDYACISRHMKQIGGIRSVADIGCAFGFQNLYFRDIRYIGIDDSAALGLRRWAESFHPIPFFREGEAGVAYHVGVFPKGMPSEVEADAFISNMSVGYGRTNASDEEIAGGYAKFERGYFQGPPEIENIVFGVFPKRTPLKKRIGWLYCVEK